MAIYGEEIVIVCDFSMDNVWETYSGFCVRRLDNDEEVARFYDGDPIEDIENALAYAFSISSRVYKSGLLDHFWRITGLKPDGAVKNA